MTKMYDGVFKARQGNVVRVGDLRCHLPALPERAGCFSSAGFPLVACTQLLARSPSNGTNLCLGIPDLMDYAEIGRRPVPRDKIKTKRRARETNAPLFSQSQIDVPRLKRRRKRSAACFHACRCLNFRTLLLYQKRKFRTISIETLALQWLIALHDSHVLYRVIFF